MKQKKVHAIGLNSGGKKANGLTFGPAVSANGKFVAFGSKATNLGKDADIHSDVFARRWK